MLTMPDRDTQAVMGLLRAALTASGMTQAGFAQSLGTSGPRLSTYLNGQTRPSAWFCLRAQRVAADLATTRRRGLMSAPDTASAMGEHLVARRMEWVWRMLLQGRDHLVLILDETEHGGIGAWEACPDSTGSAQWDTLLGVLVAREFERAGMMAPAWSGFTRLKEAWMPEHPFLDPERVKAQTPDWLRELNIYAPARDLVTA